jgi:hypothetical protein
MVSMVSMSNKPGVPDLPTFKAGSTEQERLDFLKQIIASTEANIRTYDVKSQISMGAFVLSNSPLVYIINSACGENARSILAITLIVFITTVLSLLWVLWPVPPPGQRLTEGLKIRDLYYLHNPLAMSGAGFSERLKGLVVEPELTAEALKLAYIRHVKARRFKNALIVTVAAYGVNLASFFIVGRCAL